MKRLPAAALLATASLALSGCLGSGSDEDQIRSTFSDAASAFKAGDGSKFCATLTPQAATAVGNSAREMTGTEGCSEVVSNIIKAVKSLESGDWKGFCDAIGPTAAAQVAKNAKTTSCVTATTALANTPGGKEVFAQLGAKLKEGIWSGVDAKLEDLKVDGDKATAKLATGGAQPTPFSFAKVDGKWKITFEALAGSGGSSQSGGTSGSGNLPAQ